MASPAPEAKTVPPFVAYANEQRPKLKEANPTLSFASLQKELAASWSQLTEDQKQPYKNQPAKPKSKPTPDYKQQSKPNFPKLAPSPLTHYLATERAAFQQEFPLMNRLELTGVMISRWEKLSNEEKQKYEAHSAAESIRYKAEWATFVEKNPDFEMDEDSDGGDEDEEEEEELSDDDLSDGDVPDDLSEDEDEDEDESME